jgi:hypothetical protein
VGALGIASSAHEHLHAGMGAAVPHATHCRPLHALRAGPQLVSRTTAAVIAALLACCRACPRTSPRVDPPAAAAAAPPAARAARARRRRRLRRRRASRTSRLTSTSRSRPSAACTSTRSRPAARATTSRCRGAGRRLRLRARAWHAACGFSTQRKHTQAGHVACMCGNATAGPAVGRGRAPAAAHQARVASARGGRQRVWQPPRRTP